MRYYGQLAESNEVTLHGHSYRKTIFSWTLAVYYHSSTQEPNREAPAVPSGYALSSCDYVRLTHLHLLTIAVHFHRLTQPAHNLQQ